MALGPGMHSSNDYLMVNVSVCHFSQLTIASNWQVLFRAYNTTQPALQIVFNLQTMKVDSGEDINNGGSIVIYAIRDEYEAEFMEGGRLNG